MADGEYGDEGFASGDYFYDDEWLYIEDEVAFAVSDRSLRYSAATWLHTHWARAPLTASKDELAESQIPSPGYSGVNAELMLEWYESLEDSRLGSNPAITWA